MASMNIITDQEEAARVLESLGLSIGGYVFDTVILQEKGSELGAAILHFIAIDELGKPILLKAKLSMIELAVSAARTAAGPDPCMPTIIKATPR